MNAASDAVRNARSLIEDLGLPYPSGPLLESFVTEALDQETAAHYVTSRLERGEGSALVADWSYIVDSSEFRIPNGLPYPPKRTSVQR